MTYSSMRSSLKNQRGFTLIEIAIVLTIVGLVIGGIWLAASTVYNNRKKTQLGQDAVQIVQNVRNLYAGQSASTANSITTAAAITAGAIPSNLILAGNATATTAFGGGSLTTVTSPNANQFVITMSGIPQDACIEMLSGRLAQTAQGARRIGLVTVNGVGQAAFPITPVVANGACPVANNVSQVQATFTIL